MIDFILELPGYALVVGALYYWHLEIVANKANHPNQDEDTDQ